MPNLLVVKFLSGGLGPVNAKLPGSARLPYSFLLFFLPSICCSQIAVARLVTRIEGPRRFGLAGSCGGLPSIRSNSLFRVLPASLRKAA